MRYICPICRNSIPFSNENGLKILSQHSYNGNLIADESIIDIDICDGKYAVKEKKSKFKEKELEDDFNPPKEVGSFSTVKTHPLTFNLFDKFKVKNVCLR